MNKSPLSVVTAACLIATAGVSVGTAQSASAASCKGSNSRDLVVADPRTGGQTWDVKVDSCKANQLVDAYGKAKDAAGLVGMLGAKWWPVGVTSGITFGWAWANQESVKSCASKGTGIKFKEVNGVVMSCSAQ